MLNFDKKKGAAVKKYSNRVVWLKLVHILVVKEKKCYRWNEMLSQEHGRNNAIIQLYFYSSSSFSFHFWHEWKKTFFFSIDKMHFMRIGFQLCTLRPPILFFIRTHSSSSTFFFNKQLFERTGKSFRQNEKA